MGSDGRYIHHLRIALGSLGELGTDMELAVRLGFISATNADAVEKQLTRTRELLFGLLRSVRRKRFAKTGNCVALLSVGVWFLRHVVLG